MATITMVVTKAKMPFNGMAVLQGGWGDTPTHLEFPEPLSNLCFSPFCFQRKKEKKKNAEEIKFHFSEKFLSKVKGLKIFRWIVSTLKFPSCWLQVCVCVCMCVREHVMFIGLGVVVA